MIVTALNWGRREENPPRSDRARHLPRSSRRDRLYDRLSKSTRQLVCRPDEAVVQSAELDLCAGLDGYLRYDSDCWVADLEYRLPGNGDAIVGHPNGTQFPLAPNVFFPALARRRSCSNRVAARCNRRVYRTTMAKRPGILGLVPSLCRLDCLCISAQSCDREPELKCESSQAAIGNWSELAGRPARASKS